MRESEQWILPGGLVFGSLLRLRHVRATVTHVQVRTVEANLDLARLRRTGIGRLKPEHVVVREFIGDPRNSCRNVIALCDGIPACFRREDAKAA